MAVQFELYQRAEALESEEDADAIHRRELVEKLGFSPQLQLVREIGDEASRFYPELTGFELEVWTLFHRTYYRKSDDKWSEYHFDRVPTDVLDAISFADEFGSFDDLELWTPEHGPRQQLDPMAVGVVGDRLGNNSWPVIEDLGRNAAFNRHARFFPIVRWGESLLALEEIARRVLLSRFKHWGTRPPSVTDALLEYAKPQFEQDPRMQFRYKKANSRHCGERMMLVNDVKVCVVCCAR